MRHYEFNRLSLKLAYLGEGWMETTQGTSAAALALWALSAQSSLNTLDWRLSILAISELCIFITTYPAIHVSS